MTVEQAIEQLEFDENMLCFNPSTGEEYSPDELPEQNLIAYQADEIAIEALLNQHRDETVMVRKGLPMKQTEDYITLKPIANRFKEIAMSISDKEIKSLIKTELSNQIKEQVTLGFDIQSIVEEWVENNEDFVFECIENCLKEKFSI